MRPLNGSRGLMNACTEEEDHTSGEYLTHSIQCHLQTPRSQPSDRRITHPRPLDLGNPNTPLPYPELSFFLIFCNSGQ